MAKYKDVPDWFFNQAAVIPFIKDNSEVKIVLITSSNTKRWIIPKGVIDKNLSPEEAAANEAIEEAGVKGKVYNTLIGEYEYHKWDGICKVKVYPLQVTEVFESWDDKQKRERKIVEISTAIEMVKDEIKPIIIKFMELNLDNIFKDISAANE